MSDDEDGEDDDDEEDEEEEEEEDEEEEEEGEEGGVQKQVQNGVSSGLGKATAGGWLRTLVAGNRQFNMLHNAANYFFWGQGVGGHALVKCCGSLTYFYRSESADLYLRRTDPDPDPAIFFRSVTFQKATKIFLLITLRCYICIIFFSKIKSPKEITKP